LEVLPSAGSGMATNRVVVNMDSVMVVDYVPDIAARLVVDYLDFAQDRCQKPAVGQDAVTYDGKVFIHRGQSRLGDCMTWMSEEVLACPRSN
jgi:hypothetical protein